jgi:hypothetical protein
VLPSNNTRKQQFSTLSIPPSSQIVWSAGNVLVVYSSDIFSDIYFRWICRNISHVCTLPEIVSEAASED